MKEEWVSRHLLQGHLTHYQVTLFVFWGAFGLPSMVQTIILTFLGCWALILPTLVIFFLVGWLPCFSRCNNTCWDRHFLVLDDITKCMSHVTLMCLFLCTTFWKLNGSISTPIVGFFSGLLPWAWICFPLIDVLLDITQTRLCSCPYSCAGLR